MGAHARILVVDDSSDIRESYQLLLEAEGYEVETAEDGEQGFDVVRRNRPDIILLDVVMPGMDGLEMLLRLRSDLPPPIPPVVLCSGFDLTEEEALRRGAALFLRKPIEVEDLYAAVRAALDRRAVAPETQKRQRERASEARRRVLDGARELVARMEAHGPDALATFEDRAQAKISTLSEYLAIARGVIALVHDERLIVLAATPPTGLRRGVDFGRAVPEAYEVLETGSSLLLPDASAHPFGAVSSALGGIRFFAGAPMLVDGGGPVGVVCLFDAASRPIDGEDLAALQLFGRRGSEVLATFAHSGDAERAIRYGHGVVVGDVFAELLDAELRLLARAGGSMELAVIETSDLERVSKLLARSRSRQRLLAGGLPHGRIGLFKRAPDHSAGDTVAIIIDELRASGVLREAGIVDLVDTNLRSLGADAVIALATQALDRAAGSHGGVRRIVIEERAR